MLAENTTIPRSRASFSTARCTAAENGLATSSSSRAIAAVRPSVRSSRAPGCGRKPSSSIARCTLTASAVETPGSSLTTRETVFRLTSASWATSRMVGRRRGAGTLCTIVSIVLGCLTSLSA
jgi:hypothetical protein